MNIFSVLLALAWLAPQESVSPPTSPKQASHESTPARPSDAEDWESWWRFNKTQVVDLRAHFAGARVAEDQIRGVIVPRLLDLLQHDASEDVKTSCMIALAKIGESKTTSDKSPIADAIRPFVLSTSQEIGETASIALGILGRRESIAVLTAVLERDVPKLYALRLGVPDYVPMRTRAFAAYALGLIGSGASTDDRIAINKTLGGILDRESGSKQADVCVACISAMGLTQLPVEIVLYPTCGMSGPLKLGSAQLLSWRQDQLEYLPAIANDESVAMAVRAHAPTAIARLLSAPEDSSNAPLRAYEVERFTRDLAADSKTPELVQQSCVLALGILGDCGEAPTDRAIRALLMRASSQPATRHFALVSLARVCARAGRGQGDPLAGVRTKLEQENARSFLWKAWTEAQPATKPWAALAVGIMERALQDAGLATPTESKASVRAALATAVSPSDRGAFALACGLMRDADSKDALLAILAKSPSEPIGWLKPDSYRGDPNGKARCYAAIALGLLGDRTSLLAIREMLEKSVYENDVYASAIFARRRLDDEKVASELISRLEKAQFLSAQANICTALAAARDARAVEPLLTFLKREDVLSLARMFAIEALGTLCDTDELPWGSRYADGVNYRATTPTLTDPHYDGILDID